MWDATYLDTLATSYLLESEIGAGQAAEHPERLKRRKFKFRDIARRLVEATCGRRTAALLAQRWCADVYAFSEVNAAWVLGTRHYGYSFTLELDHFKNLIFIIVSFLSLKFKYFIKDSFYFSNLDLCNLIILFS